MALPPFISAIQSDTPHMHNPATLVLSLTPALVLHRRVFGGSRFMGLKTLVRYTAFTTLAGFLAWQAHPYLLDAIGYVLDLNWKE